jgi:hypothetical protein
LDLEEEDIEQEVTEGANWRDLRSAHWLGCSFNPKTEVQLLMQTVSTTDYTDFTDFPGSMNVTLTDKACFPETLKNLCSLCNLPPAIFAALRLCFNFGIRVQLSMLEV